MRSQESETKIQSIPASVEEPNVEHMGLYYNLMFGDTGVGFNFSHSLDFGANYKIPYYTEREYLVLGTDVSFHVGMFQWIQIILPFLSAGVNIELNGVKIVPSFRLLYDITTYNDVCSSFEVYTKGLEMVVTGSVEIPDCSMGVFGSIYELLLYSVYKWPRKFGQAFDCETRSYWFEKTPIFRIGLDNIVKEWWQQTIKPETCMVRQKAAWE